MLRLLTGFIVLFTGSLWPTAQQSAATPPIPVSKPFVIKTTPFESPAEPSSFSHKMIIVFPETKPEIARAITADKGKEQQATGVMDFDDILSSAVKDEITGYILPPALPEWKRLAANPSVPASDAQIIITSQAEIIIDGNIVPLPHRKPQSYAAPINTENYVSISEMASIKARNKEYDERQAGSRVPTPPPSYYNSYDRDERTASYSQQQPRTASIERTPAIEIGKLKEANAASPFKSKKAQKAGKPTNGDPIILFFQENSPELEVGQIDILKEDVIEALKYQPEKQATVYGFATPNRNDPETARQLAVSRAMMVREYIVDKRINGDRINIQAIMNDDQLMPKDRVDIVIR